MFQRAGDAARSTTMRNGAARGSWVRAGVSIALESRARASPATLGCLPCQGGWAGTDPSLPEALLSSAARRLGDAAAAVDLLLHLLHGGLELQEGRISAGDRVIHRGPVAAVR